MYFIQIILIIIIGHFISTTETYYFLTGWTCVSPECTPQNEVRILNKLPQFGKYFYQKHFIINISVSAIC